MQFGTKFFMVSVSGNEWDLLCFRATLYGSSFLVRAFAVD